MKICYLGDNGSVHNQKWIKGLIGRPGFELHVITFNRGLKYDGVNYHYLKNYFGNKVDYILNAPLVKKLVKEIQPDILHAQYATSYGYLGAQTNFHPFVITGWGADIFDSPKNEWMKKALKYSFRKADSITVLSKITEVEIKKFTNKNIELIPFGVDINLFKPNDKKNDGVIRIGTIRSLTTKYGIEFLIRAFAKVCETVQNVELDIIGDGELRNELEQLVQQFNLSDRVKFHGFVSQQADFEKYYSILSTLDVFAILSIMDSETFGVASVEASACGIPVIATRVGGLPEVVIDGKTGFIVPPKDVQETAAAIIKIITNPELSDRMKKEARQFVVENYNWEKSLDKMILLYRKLLIETK